jgi:hypothetical protein
MVIMKIPEVSEPARARCRAFRPVPWAALGAAAAVTALSALVPGSACAAGIPAHAKITASARPAAYAGASARGGPRGGGKAAAAAGGTPLVHDTFKEATAPEFTGYNDACLTGAEALPSGHNPAAGDHPLGGCGPANTATTDASLYTGPVPPRDAPRLGYLELTNARTNRTGAVLFNEPVEASAGLDLSFESWQYGGSADEPGRSAPADGISFFLTDGEFDLDAPGAFGGSLGYAQKKQHIQGEDNSGPPDHPGVAGGYLGVGLDVFGNFFANTEQRGYGCGDQRSPAGSQTSDSNQYDRGPNMVTIRGPVIANTGNFGGYCYITATSDYAHKNYPPNVNGWPSNLTGRLQGDFTGPISGDPATAERQLASSGRLIHIIITPGEHPTLTVTVSFGTDPQTVLTDVPLPTPPPTYKFGFAASTGHFTDIHLIRNVVINSDEPLPAGIDLVKQVDETRLPGHLTAGDDIHYEYVAGNTGKVPVTGLTVDDTKVSPVTCQKTSLEPGDETVCAATYTVTATDVANGKIANIATAHGLADGAPVVSNPHNLDLPLTEPPGIFVEKLVQTPGPYHAGQPVEYRYLVSNTGGIPLDGVHVTDDRVTGITCDSTTLAPYLSPGYQTTCRGSHVITEHDAFVGLVIDTATATGTAEHRTVTAPQVQAELTVSPPRIEVEKEVETPGPYVPGSTVRYAYEVTDTGPRTFHALVVADDHVANVACDTTTLRLGQSTTCHGSYVVTAFDAAAGHVTNEADAEAIDPDGNVMESPTVSETIPVEAFVPVTG